MTGEQLVVYDICDREGVCGLTGTSKTIVRLETETLAQADVVFSTARVLQEAKSRYLSAIHSGGRAVVPVPRVVFDGVVMFDHLEHSPAPGRELGEARRLLRTGGLFLVETPNAAGLSVMLMRRRWPLIRPPEHLCYFGARNLSTLLKRFGFEVVSRRTGRKVVTLEYLCGKLRVTHEKLGRVLSGLCRRWSHLAQAPLLIPVGSFILLARKRDDVADN